VKKEKVHRRNIVARFEYYFFFGFFLLAFFFATIQAAKFDYLTIANVAELENYGGAKVCLLSARFLIFVSVILCGV
jgi:hypothetical protein